MNWIKCSDKMPTPYVCVLTQRHDELYPVVAYWASDANSWIVEPEGQEDTEEHVNKIRERITEPTHWMPLPKSPE